MTDKNTAIPTSSQQDSLTCGVCGQKASGLKCGAIVCEGCKHFFLKYRKAVEKLSCITGLGKCNEKAKDLIAVNPNFRRQFCRQCRFRKCLEIGMFSVADTTRKRQIATAPLVAVEKDDPIEVMEAVDTSNSSSENSSLLSTKTYESPTASGTSLAMVPIIRTGQVLAGSLENYMDRLANNNDEEKSLRKLARLAKAPPRFECIHAELSLKVATRAATELSGFDSIPYTTRPLTQIGSELELWMYAMQNLECISKIGIAYVKLLDGMANNLPLSDRCYLFSRTLASYLTVQVCLPSHYPYRFFGMPESTRQLYTRAFPAAEAVGNVIDEIASIMQVWNPSYAEFALLQAINFFRVDISGKLSNPTSVVETNRTLNMALSSLLAQQVQSPEQKAQNLQFFQRIGQLLLNIEFLMCGMITELVMMRPDLLQFNQLLSEMFTRWDKN